MTEGKHRRFLIDFSHKDGPSWHGYAEIDCHGPEDAVIFGDLMVAVRRMEREIPASMQTGVLVCTIAEPTSARPDVPVFKLMRASHLSAWYVETRKYAEKD